MLCALPHRCRGTQGLRLAFAGLLLVALGGAGCFEVREDLEIRDKTTGTFRVQVSLPLQVCRDFASAAPALARCLDPATGATLFTEDRGFRLTKYRVFDTADRKFVQVEGKLLDLQKALASGVLGPFTYTLNEDGTRKLALTWPAALLAGPARPPPADLAAVLAGSALTLTVEVPREIVRASTTDVQGTVAKWTFRGDAASTLPAHPPEIQVIYR